MRYPLMLAALLACAVLISCSDDDDNPPPPAELPIIGFGSHFTVITNTTGPLGQPLPVLAGDSVMVTVGFSGCSPDQSFELRHRLFNADRAELWLYKASPDEPCQAYFQPTLTFRVHPSVLSRNSINLITPGFGVIPLR